jgi:hypothetical protein
LKRAGQPFEQVFGCGKPAKSPGQALWPGRKLVRLAKLLPDNGLGKIA